MILLTKTKTQIRQENDLYFNSRNSKIITPDSDILPPSERIDRIRYYEDKPLEWMTTYNPDDFTSEFADHHPEMITHLDIRGRLVVIIIFRNSGKGTILKGYTMHSICYGKEPYMTRMEHDRETAINELLDLTHEFQTNTRIIADYGMLSGDLYGMPWRPAKGEVFFRAPVLSGITRENEYVYVRYIGLKNLIRGTVTLNRKRIGRLIVNDPVKGYEEAHSPTHTVKTVHTIKSDAGFAGGSYKEKPISVTVVGTCQARGDVIDQLRSEPMAKTLALPGLEGEESVIKEFMETISDDIPSLRDFIDRIEDEEHRNDTQEDHEEYISQHLDKYGKYLSQIHSTWAARFTIPDYIFIAANWGTDVFMQEVQHETIDVALQRFFKKWFPQYDGSIPDEYSSTSITIDKNHPIIYAMTIDVAGEPREGSDPMAIYAGAYHKELKNLYTKYFWCDQATPKELAERAYKVFWECFPWYKGKGVIVYLEDVASFSGIGRAYFDTVRKEKIQEVKEIWEERIDQETDIEFIEQLHRNAKAAIEEAKCYWIRLPIKLLNPSSMGNKLAGISALRPIVEHRQIWYNPKHSQQKLLVTQFTEHRGKHTHDKMPVEFKNEGPDCVRMMFFTLKKSHGIKPVFAYGNN